MCNGCHSAPVPCSQQIHPSTPDPTTTTLDYFQYCDQLCEGITEDGFYGECCQFTFCHCHLSYGNFPTICDYEGTLWCPQQDGCISNCDTDCGCEMDSTTTTISSTTTSTTTTTTSSPYELLYSADGYEYYKVPVKSGERLVEGKVAETCRAAEQGLEAVCSGNTDCKYTDTNYCSVTPLSTNCGNPM